jgi:hypothetical protein
MRIRTAVVGGLLAVALVGCGAAKDDAGDGVASAGGPATSSSAPGAGEGGAEAGNADPMKFAKCMRENGVDIPDPEMNGNGGVGIALPAGDPAKLDAAMKACDKFMGGGSSSSGSKLDMKPEDIERMRKMAKCMRENGVTDFPDPETGGTSVGGSISVGPGGTIDATSKVFEEAMKKCGPLAGMGEKLPELGG